jgi:hypothetical protein
MKTSKFEINKQTTTTAGKAPHLEIRKCSFLQVWDDEEEHRVVKAQQTDLQSKNCSVNAFTIHVKKTNSSQNK